MFRIRLAIAALAVAVLMSGTTRAADPAAAKVLTPDAKGFIHVRVGDIWTADVAKQLRQFVGQAGAGLIAEFDNSFYPAPSDVESFTVVLFDTNKFRDVLPNGHPSDVTPVWVITSKKALDKAELLKTMSRTGKLRKHGDKEYHFDEANWSGLLILDANSYAYASEDSITKLIDRMAKGGDSPLAATFTREADKHPVTLGVNVQQIATPDFVKGAPPEFGPLFKAKTLLGTLDLKPKTTVALALEFPTAAEAKDGLKGAQDTVQYARGQIGQALTFVEQRAKRDPAKGKAGVQEFSEAIGFLLAAAGLKQLDALLGAMPVELKDTTVRASLELDSVLPGGSTALSIGVVAMAIGMAISDSERIVRSDGYEFQERERNLKMLAQAIEKYHKDKGHYPPPAILDKDGKPLLSWRVELLPYMENVYINEDYRDFDPKAKRISTPKELYEAFKLDEPWDGPNNKKLITRLPSIYRVPWGIIPYRQSSAGKTLTMAVVGKGGIFDPTKKTVNEGDVRDPLKHTLLLVHLEEASFATYWSKPADIELTEKGELPANGPNLAKRFAVVYGDGSAHTLENGLDAKTFLGIFTREGNEKLDEKVIRPESKRPKGFDEGPIPK